MQELTGYILTTERVHFAEALESLESQGIPRPVVVVRNVRPLQAASLPTLACETPYCLVLDDDTVLNPGVAQQLLDEFTATRAKQPAAFKLNARVYSEAKLGWDMGGLKLFYVPHLRRVGWPDAPHVSHAQSVRARGMGLYSVKCEIDAGVQKRGTNLDVYKKYLWMQLRFHVGQLGPTPLEAVAQRAREGIEWLWFAVLGLADGMATGTVSTSKDEDFLGPIGRTLDFDVLSGQDVRRLLEDRGLTKSKRL